ncbi:MAG TPA: copper resistance CopC family protein [Methylomirabilota bacterium]|nr:copper resistance CopC family protein [Methylomirabilota bacterium]
MRPVKSPLAVAAAILLAALLVATSAIGHAFLDRAEPRVGSKVRTPPAQVRLWFTERLEPAYSRVQVMNEAGQQVDRADASLDPGDPRQLRVSLAPVGPGTYRVLWRVLSVDTHITEGDFKFHVVP